MTEPDPAVLLISGIGLISILPFVAQLCVFSGRAALSVTKLSSNDQSAVAMQKGEKAIWKKLLNRLSSLDSLFSWLPCLCAGAFYTGHNVRPAPEATVPTQLSTFFSV